MSTMYTNISLTLILRAQKMREIAQADADACRDSFLFRGHFSNVPSRGERMQYLNELSDAPTLQERK